MFFEFLKLSQPNKCLLQRLWKYSVVSHHFSMLAEYQLGFLSRHRRSLVKLEWLNILCRETKKSTIDAWLATVFLPAMSDPKAGGHAAKLLYCVFQDECP